MTAFDKLCRMLDERGARYFRQEREGKGTLARVSWEYPTGSDSPDVFVATVVRYGDHLRFRGYLTPEQAIGATLDSSNCSNSERTSNELLPCPFCGGEAEIVHTPKVIPYEPWWIRCSLCEVTTPKYKSETAKADAIAAWNRRAES